MNEKSILKRRIEALDFSIYELELFLDTHPENSQAMQMLCEFRRRRSDAVENYESDFGTYIQTTRDVTPGNYWNWIDSPWPWEREV